MADADDSYHFEDIPAFIKELNKGYDLVVGNRFKGGIDEDAMSFSHRLGTPVLSWMGRMLFNLRIHDVNCGMRAMRKQSILKIGLQASGMEFAMEMIAKASLKGLRISEAPTRLSRDGRHHGSHLRTVRDGMRIVTYMAKERMHAWFDVNVQLGHKLRQISA
jgi:glycosyltransferase involved in cell wall biosynthesis